MFSSRNIHTNLSFGMGGEINNHPGGSEAGDSSAPPLRPSTDIGRARADCNSELLPPPAIVLTAEDSTAEDLL
ncbi:hypothetical protein E2C01_019287 [Portunus trituberculatus]|uniref:Uncharacterized protein n=1 Tax=Portunus trituberculatus TaxID=210409 RepID=A0A5B7DZZ8_PORTR|nr:hypothetical protein [Portunus trituberculatus]